MKYKTKFSRILAILISFGKGLFSQIQIGGRMVEIKIIIPFILGIFIIPSHIAAQSVNDTLVYDGAANELVHRELSARPAPVAPPSVNSTKDQKVAKRQVTNLPILNPPIISRQPMMRFAGDPAFNDWVVYKTLKARLAEDNNDQ